jgi:sRNA-binding carbon storage regulator CsrA
VEECAVRSVPRAKDQAIAIGSKALLSVLRIDAGRVRIGLRCPAEWPVEQLELAELKLAKEGRPWRRPLEPIWHAPPASPSATAEAGVKRSTRFFELPVNGALKIGPAIRVRVAGLTDRVAVFEIDGAADEEIEAV